MVPLRFVGLLLGSLWHTLWRRWRRGPLRPSWSFLFEAFTRALKAQSAELARATPAERRAHFEAMVAPSPLRWRMRCTRATLGGVPVEWLVPKAAAADAPVLLYLHGGSYQYGSTNTHRELMTRLALAASVRVLAVEYRLAPEHPFPAALEDALAVIRALRADGQPMSRLLVGGESAGGGLTVAVLSALRDGGEPLPRAGLALCPWVDLSARGGSLIANAPFDWAEPEDFAAWAQLYLGAASPTDPRASPGLGRLTGLPPLLVAVGTAEMLHTQVLAFVDAARTAGVAVTLLQAPDMVHAWFLFAAVFARCRETIAQLAGWIQQQTANR